MSPTIFGLTLAAALGSALVAGVLFAFSTSVMDALDRVPPGQAVNAMNQINETIVRPGFMLAFVGTAILCRVLGVHAIGTGATELIHIGQAVMVAGMPVDYFVDSIFNYPTLAECYKVAALNGLNKLKNL